MTWDQDGDPTSVTQLGRYTLLCPVAVGELSTVYLARQQSDAGFSRLVALKRLRPDLAREREYVDMMQDEARIGAGLNHANILAAIDVGGPEGECFVAFEYVEGDSLAGLVSRRPSAPHPRFLAPLFVDALAGLHAAHTAYGPDDQPMHLVHQAPRAEHILIGIDGIARLADFGQVRSPALRPNRLRTDRLRVGYMAPEQLLRPDVVDHRADLFILGTTLWEALTGRKLFESYSEEQSFQNLLHRQVQPPSEVCRGLPSCFDDICLRALEREPDDRYESAAHMARELRDAAINHALFATAPEVGQWVKALCGSDLIARRRLAGSEAPSQQMRVPLPDAPERRPIAPYFDDPPTTATTAPPPGPAADPSGMFDDEVTALHFSPSELTDSDEVPLFMDRFVEESDAYPSDPFLGIEGSGPAPAPDAAPVQAYDRDPDSGELPDFSDPDRDPDADSEQSAATRVFSEPPPRDVGEERSGIESLSAHEAPTRVMPAPSEQASAIAREVASRSSVPPGLAGGTTPAYGTELPASDKTGDEAASSSRPPASARVGSKRPSYREENVSSSERHDSTPTRMRLSTGPVGDVFSTAPPPPSELVSEEVEVDVAAEIPPPAPAPASAQARPPFDPPNLGADNQGLPDTLTPPSQSHTLPPDDDDPFASPRRGVGTYVAVGFVAVAAAVTLAWVMTHGGDGAAAVANEPARIEDPDFVAAPGGDEPQGAAQGEAEPATAAMAESAQAAESAEAVETEQGDEQVEEATPEAAASPAQAPSKAAPARKPAVRRPVAKRPVRRPPPAHARPQGTPPAAPSAQPAPAAKKPTETPPAPAKKPAKAGPRPADWRGRGEAIPDNPF